MSSPRARGIEPAIGWMLLLSAWMLLTVIPGPILAWLGFLIVGVVGRMPRWIMTGVALGVAAIVARFPIWGQYGAIAVAVVYLAGMLLALAANPSWLRAMWQRGQASAGTAQRTAAAVGRERAVATTSAPSRNQRRKQNRRGRSSSTVARTATTSEPESSTNEEAASLAAAAGASTGSFFRAEPTRETAEPVDVNSATVNELAGLPGMNKSKARSAIKARDRQGGFRTLEAFAMVAELQPHELVRLRDAATCSPPPRGPRSFGRRVDF